MCFLLLLFLYVTLIRFQICLFALLYACIFKLQYFINIFIDQETKWTLGLKYRNVGNIYNLILFNLRILQS